MSWLVILILILVGITFILLEMLVVPGTTVVGIIGVALMIFAIYVTYSNYGNATGTYVLAGTLIFFTASIVFALKSNTWRKAMLGTEIGGKVNTREENTINKGDEGLSVTRLNPMGKALINGDYYEVTSKDNLIDQNTEIVVTKVDGNKIIVKSKLI